MKKLYITLLSLPIAGMAFGQNVGINTDGAIPNDFFEVKPTGANSAEGVLINNVNTGDGDAVLKLANQGTVVWSLGLDDSDADNFKVSRSTGLGTSDRMTFSNAASVFNEQSADIDFRIESNGQANAFFINAGSDQVIVRRTTQHLGYTDPFSVYVSDNATIPFAVNGWNQGTTGGGATFQNENAGNGYSAMESYTPGTGSAAFIWNTNTGNNRVGVWAQTSAPNNRYGVYSPDNIAASGWVTVSDERLKKEINPVGSALNKVLQLNPVTYYYNNEVYESFGEDQDLQYGFLAQEVELIFPEIALENAVVDPNTVPNEPRSDWSTVQMDFMGMNYQALIPILTKAIQEQQEQIELLQQQVQDLILNGGDGSPIRN